MQLILSLFIIIPIFAFLVSLFFKNKNEKGLAFLIQATTGLYIVASISLLLFWISKDSNIAIQKILTLYKTDGFEFAFVLFYDINTAVYSVVGSIVFYLVARFSHFYMHRDEGFKRFFNTFLFFLIGFNLIIFSGNFETFFIGWEFIGLASFLLISFYRNRYLPVKNAFKTLSIYRVSDIALILAMWLLHHLTHQNINFNQLNEFASNQHTELLIIISMMFVIAAVAKSAQFPFTSWLPRAMEGPTSSSAIFYGSLSVHIGVFLLLRTYPFWQNIFWVKFLIILIGLLTSIISTLISRVQPTIKTQIAYSSAAQIGIIFIEVAMGWHVLALVHFAGNSFLRTYQLLVSPSVLNYLIHHQYFHHNSNINSGKNKFLNSLYMLGIKEWNLDVFLHDYLWHPFKWIGRKLNFLECKFWKSIIFLLIVIISFYAFQTITISDSVKTFFQYLSLIVAISIMFYAFASRKSAIVVWHLLFVAHIFIALFFKLLANSNSINQQIILYFSGITIAYVIGYLCLNKVHKIDEDLSLNNYHGYVYEQKFTATIFLLSAIALLGFPITTAFIGIDVLFTHVELNQPIFITLLALCLLFLELAVIRIYLRIFLGPHKKLDHPIAYRSS